MAAKPDVKENPPIYEISPNRIFIYLVVNFAVAVVACVLSHLLESPFPVFYYFLAIFILLGHFCREYFFLPEYIDIPAQFYHPDLIPQKEFEYLYERFKAVQHNLRLWNNSDNPFYKRDKQEYDNLKSIIVPQNELRAICLFKTLIGVQQCSVKNDNNVGKKIVNGSVNNLDTKSSAINDKIPSYEISPKWILIYLTVNFITSLTASVLSFTLENPWPLLIYFLIYFAVVFHLLIDYDRKEFCDISSLISHPDLMPENEFKNLKKRFEEIAEIKRNYYHANQSLPEKYQLEYDTLKPIFDAQNELRNVCWFKKLIGVPKFVVHENPTKIMAEDSNAEAFDEPESDSEFDSSDSSFDSIDVSPITDNKSESRKTMSTLKAENVDMKNDIENLKARFAALEAENAKLKNFIEAFIESQAIV